jgi:hypothetical protein
MAIRCEVKTIEGFVQQLAVGLVSRGYWFYVTGWIPEQKDPRAVDEKITRLYGIGLTRSSRMRRKQAGRANVQYLRLGRFFVIIATHGLHPFFESEGKSVRDIRRSPLVFGGYSVSHRGGKASVRIDLETYRTLKASFVGCALRMDEGKLAERFTALPFQPYAPIRRQFLSLWRAVNRARGTAGLEPVPQSCLRFKRRIVRPFEEVDSSQTRASDGSRK